MEQTQPPAGDDRYRVETPEQIGLDYDIAGLGSRGLAAIIDTAILTLVMSLVFCLGSIGLGSLFNAFIEPMSDTGDPGTGFLLALAVITLLMFAILWGYYVLFETIWHGQTPGKRWTGLRVIQEGGYPIGFSHAAIRNIARLIDFLPMTYIIGATVMLFDRRSRRLGDFIAGTVVVKEQREVTLDSLGSSATPVSTAGWPAGFGEPRQEPEPIPNLERLTAEDHRLIREYFQRRGALNADAAAQLALRLSTAFAAKLDYIPAGDVPEQFLARIARQASSLPRDV